MTPQTLPDRLLADDPRATFADKLAAEIRRIDGDHSLGAGALADALTPFIEREAAAALSVGEAVAIGWVFQHDDTGRMTFCPNDGVNTPEVFAELNPGYTLCSAAYTHPTPSAVEALARAAEGLRFDVFKVASPELRALFDGAKSICVLQQETVAPLRSALRHPEIAALLKGEKK